MYAIRSYYVKDINLRLTDLTNTFEQNLLAETNDFKMVLDSESDLSGLPDDVIATAAATAQEMDLAGNVITSYSMHYTKLYEYKYIDLKYN